MDDTFNFESNKITAPPNSNGSHRPGHGHSHVHASSTTLASDGVRSLFPKRQLSLKLLSPNSKFKSNLSATNARLGDITTPKTRGIKLLKKTSSQYNNKEFTKRLSIPSFHVADQILMDILTEQNQSNNAMNMNVIQEDEIHDDDDDIDIDILEFMYDGDGNGDGDEDEDTDLDSVMTLDAFPDLPDFGHTMEDDGTVDNNTPNLEDNSPLIDNNTPLSRVTHSQSAYTPHITDDDDDDTYQDHMDDEDDEDTYQMDDEDDDESLTPRTYNRLFNNFHRTDEKKEEIAPKSQPPQYSLSTKQLQINISQFKSVGATANTNEEAEAEAEAEEKDNRRQSGFSRLQRSASMKLVVDQDNITTLLRKSASYSAVESVASAIEIEEPIAKKKMSSAESAILVAKELLETEDLYQNHLKKLQYILLRPIISTYFGNDCISSIFYGLLCDIISVSKSFTMRLSIYVKALQIPQLANWIYFSCKRFGVYAHYAKMYDIFLDRLTLCKDIDDNIEYWIRRQEKAYKTELKNQKLHSLLMMPVQRLPRYILLLEELLKHTQRIDVDDGTILFLELAKSEIQTVSQRVNEMVRQRENRSNLKELINRFCGANKAQLLRSNRVLVYEGFLYKVRKYKIKYYFHLFSDILTYSNVNNNGLFNIHRIIYLHKVAIIDLPNVDENVKQKQKKQKKQKQKYKHKIWYRFLLKSQEKSFEILTENEQEKQNWMLLIKAAISRLRNTSNDKSVSSPVPLTPQSMESEKKKKTLDTPPPPQMARKKTLEDEECYAPYWVPDDASNQCLLCNSEFTLLNRRHHCRRCGTLVCKQCSKTKRLLVNIDKNKAVRICDECVTETEEMIKLTPYGASPLAAPHRHHSHHEKGGGGSQMEINAMRLSELFPDTHLIPPPPPPPPPSQNNSHDISKEILKYTRQYKQKLRALLEHFCRPIMDVVENNKIITDLITSKRFYNRANIIHKGGENGNEKEAMIQKEKKQNAVIKEKKNKKKELRKKKRKKALEKTKKTTFSATDIKAKRILSCLYKLKCGHKTLIALCTIVEQIYDIICLLHSELKLIIFKKHVNYEDDMILDYFRLSDADHARIGRLFIMYTDLFNMHVEYASRFPECYHMIIGNVDKTENHLLDFIKDAKLSLVSLNREFILKDLLQSPLDFTRKMYQFLMKIHLQIDSASMVNSSDLNLCIQTLKQTLLDLDKEKSQSQLRIKLYKLQTSFDFSVDFRERGRTLIISDFITKQSHNAKSTSSHNYFFHLFSNILCYSAKKLGNSKFVFKNYIYLRDITAIIDGNDGHNGNETKKKKKRDLFMKSITIKYCQNIAPFDRNDDDESDRNGIHVITEEAEEEEEKEKESEKEKANIKIFSLLFDNKDKKQCWFELLSNLVTEEQAKYRKENKNKNKKKIRNHFDILKNNKTDRAPYNNRDRHARSLSLNAVKKSKKKYKRKNTDDECQSDGEHEHAQFCGVCHSSFNPLYNPSYKCCRCALRICEACCMDNFYLGKKFIAPKYIKLCVRCNYYDHNERSCNILCV